MLPLPDTNARSKRAKVEAKRASRGACAGTDLAAINRELTAFVLDGGDIKVCLLPAADSTRTCLPAGRQHRHILPCLAVRMLCCTATC